MSQTRTADTSVSLGRHQRNCSICAHPQREEIEAGFIGWRSPAAIAEEFGLADRTSVYRHAHALGLFDKRKRNIRAALERIIEKAVPTPDPTLADRITELQQRIITEQRKAEAAEKKRLDSQTHYKQRLEMSEKYAHDLNQQLREAQSALDAMGRSQAADDVALKHGGVLAIQLQDVATDLLTAWPKLAPLTIHCRLADVEAVASVQAIAEQLQTIATALQRVVQDHTDSDGLVIDVPAFASREALDA
jgi:hypothetical protein